mgnify:CR=1 FL=1
MANGHQCCKRDRLVVEAVKLAEELSGHLIVFERMRSGHGWNGSRSPLMVASRNGAMLETNSRRGKAMFEPKSISH